MNAHFWNASSNYVVDVRNSHGELRTQFDFSKLGLSLPLCLALRDAYLAVAGHTAIESRRQTWRCIQRFSKGLLAHGIGGTPQFPAATLSIYHQWLVGEKLADSTRQSQQNIVLNLVEWIDRNRSPLLEKNFVLSVPNFVRGEAKSLPALSADEIKKILSICYSEIDSIIKRINEGRRILSGDCRNEQEHELNKIMTRALALGEGLLPGMPAANKKGLDGLGRKIKDLAGGIPTLSRMLFPSKDDLLPFFLAIMAQTGGNPYPILHIKRDCVQSDALNRGNLKRIVWEKARAHKEDVATFNILRPRSAPNLIAQLLVLNDYLVNFVKQSEKNNLFIGYSNAHVGVPVYALIHIHLDAFIAKHGLPKFAPKQLRKTNGKLHERAGNIFTAKKKLNHKSVRTTERYVVDEELVNERNGLVARFQGMFIQEALGLNENVKTLSKRKAQPSAESIGMPADTTFGFQCKDPFAGIAPGSTKGQQCNEFAKCASCKGALVPMDNPKIVANLLATEMHLEELRKRAEMEGWIKRYKKLYSDTLAILRADLLPFVAESVLKEAKKLSTSIRLPFLE